MCSLYAHAREERLVAYRLRAPSYYIFCLHDATKLPQSRSYISAPDTNRLSLFQAHVSNLIRALDVDGHHYCPASAASGTDVVLCRHTDHMKIDELQAHIMMIHGIDTVEGQNTVVCYVRTWYATSGRYMERLSVAGYSLRRKGRGTLSYG